ncbi:hypothetical protein JCM6882_005988 [Rhodosporidiobolus microsporus]
MTTATPPSVRLLLLGATGATGQQALKAALESPDVTTVLTFGRSAPKVDDGVSTAKLQHTALDFEALLQEDGKGTEAAKLRDASADAVLVTLGTTRKNAGSAEKFERIDREYVLAAAKAARREDKPEQRVVYLSSAGSSATSSFLYPRSKGLTEQGLADLGYAETVIFRPGYLVVPGGRGETRIAESIFGSVTNLASSFTNRLQIPTPVLGTALVKASSLTLETLKVPAFGANETLAGKPVWALGNAQALALGGATSAKV